jgi:hypothetical protein
VQAGNSAVQYRYQYRYSRQHVDGFSGVIGSLRVMGTSPGLSRPGYRSPAGKAGFAQDCRKLQLDALALRLIFHAPYNTNKPGIRIIAQMILSGCALTKGTLPKSNPP